MRTGLNLKPGERGTKRLVDQFGDRLVCVRCRYDEEQKKRFKTVELIVEEIPWEPRSVRRSDQIVGVAVKWGEAELAGQVKLRAANGTGPGECRNFDTTAQSS
jgi:hypothetical protein